MNVLTQSEKSSCVRGSIKLHLMVVNDVTTHHSKQSAHLYTTKAREIRRYVRITDTIEDTMTCQFLLLWEDSVGE